MQSDWLTAYIPNLRESVQTHVILTPSACGREGLASGPWTISPGEIGEVGESGEFPQA